MTAVQKFDLTVFLERLEELCLDCIEDLPFVELEWILADFILSWGQRLPLDLKVNLSEQQRKDRHDFGQMYLPFSTASDFSKVPPSQIRILALASSCLTLHILLLDDLIDEPTTFPMVAKLAIQPLLLQAYRLLNRIFPVDSPFWSEVGHLLSLTSQGIMEQYEIYKQPVQIVSEGEFKRISHDVMAFAQINSVALAILNNASEAICQLKKCWKAIGLTAIICDDIYDWQKDYQNGNYTYLLSQVLFSKPFREKMQFGKFPGLHEIGAALFFTDTIESLYKLAYKELLIAEEVATQLGHVALSNLIRGAQQKEIMHSRKLSSHKMIAMLAMNIESL